MSAANAPLRCTSRNEKRRIDQAQIGPPHEAQDSMLLKLPPEIRNRINEFALVSADTMCITRQPLKGGKRRTKPQDLIAEPGLLRTCTQLRSEATPIYYGANAFGSYGREQYHTWLAMLGPNKRSMLKHVRFIREALCLNGEDDSGRAMSLYKLRDVQLDFDEAGVPLPIDVLHTACLDSGQIVYWNEGELTDHMNDWDWSRYYADSESKYIKRRSLDV